MWSQKTALQLVSVSSLLSLVPVVHPFPPGVTTPLLDSVRSLSMEDVGAMRIVSALGKSVNLCVVSDSDFHILHSIRHIQCTAYLCVHVNIWYIVSLLCICVYSTLIGNSTFYLPVFIHSTDPCSYKKCRRDEDCSVNKLTGEAFCTPSCTKGNPCERGERCVLTTAPCLIPPCPVIRSCISMS